MGVRFNKRITIFPWMKMNVGKSGVSLTIGPKGKTLNIGSTGVNVNVSLGQGMGYSKRLITWKKLNLLSMLGIGTAAAAKKGKGSKSTSKKDEKGATTVPSLDEAIAEAEGQNRPTPKPSPREGSSIQQETSSNESPSLGEGSEVGQQPGCGPVGCILGLLAVLIILALIAAVVYLLMTRPAA